MNKPQTKPKNSLLVTFVKNKRIKIIFILLFIVFFIFGFFYLKYSWNSSKEITSKQAMVIAETAGIGLNGEMLRQVKVSPEDLGTTAYESLKQRLMTIPSVDRNIRFAYIYTKIGDKIYFIADSEPVDSEGYSPPGQEYTEADMQTFQPFVDGLSLITKPSTDRWGTWVSALVPIKDAGSEKVIAVLGTDYPAEKWNREALLGISRSAVMVFSLFLLTIAIFFTYKNTLKIKENEQNFRSFFEVVDDIIIIANSRGDIIYSNDAVSQKLYYTRQELQKKKIFELCPKYKTDSEKNFHEIFTGKLDTCPLPMERKNGNILPVESRVWFGKWSGDECMFVISKDLGAEQEALQKFNKIFENNPSLMAVCSLPDGKLTDVNDSFLNKLGYTENEVIGKTIDDLGIFTQSEKTMLSTKDLNKNKFIRDAEIQIKTKSGHLLEGVFFSDIISSQGKEFLLVVIVDQTERKIATGKLQDIITATNAGTWEWNIKTGKTIFNERWAEIIGYKLKELEPISIKTWEKFTHPDDLAKSGIRLQKHFNKQTTNYSCEARMKHKNGSWIWVYDNGKVTEWDADGKPLKMFGTHIDITDTKTAEDKIIKKNEELEKLNEHMVGRELKMIEMKNEIEKLKKMVKAE